MTGHLSYADDGAARCSQCPAAATGTVVTVNGWVVDVRDGCARPVNPLTR